MFHKDNKLLLNYSNSNGFGGIIGNAIKGSKNTTQTTLSQSDIDLLNLADQKLAMGKSLDGITDKFSNASDAAKTYVNNIAAGNAQLQKGQTALNTFTKQSTGLSSVWSGIKNIGGQFLSTVLNGFVSMAASATIMFAIQSIQNLINSYEDLAKEANTIASEFNNSKTQIDDYSKKMSELRGIMDDSTSTTEEVRDATSQLYDIQSDLISTYGAYHEGIDLVNGDLEEQLGILQQINQENAQRAVDDINSKRSALSSGWNVGANTAELSALSGISTVMGSGGGVLGALTTVLPKYYANLKSGDNFWKALTRTFTESDLLGKDVGLDKIGSSVEQITDRYENFNAQIKATDNKTVNDLINSFKEFKVNGDMIEVSGSVDDVAEATVRLRTQLRSLGYENETLEQQLTKISNDAQDVVNNSSEAYNTILYNNIQGNDELLTYYTKMTDAYNKYKEAQDKGDPDKVKELEDSFKGLFEDMYADPNIGDKYIKYFENLYPELQSLISGWEFEAQVVPEINLDSGFAKQFGVSDFLRDTSLDELDALYQKLLVGGTTGSGNVDAIFRIISSEAEKAGISVKELISYMKSLPQYSDKYSSLRSLMGENWKDEYADMFTDEEIVLSVELDKGKTDIVEERLTELEKGGTVNLNLRPNINGKELKNAGWDVEEDSFATVYSSTFSDEAGTKYINFTPIVVDPETGRYMGTLSPDELTSYAEGVIAGVREDDLNLQIGGEFDTAEMAENAAEKIHDLHELKADVELGIDEDFDYEGLKEELSLLISPIKAEVELEPNASDLVSDLKDIEDAFGGLGEIESAGTSASASDIEQVNSDMGGVTFGKYGDGTSIEDVNAMSSALEKYNKVLTDNKSTTEDVDKATDDLVTSYLDLSGKLDNITEETKDKTIEELKSYGIENAEEVVVTRLNKVYKNFSKNLQTLSTKVAQYHDTLEEGVDADGFTEAAQDIAKTVKEMFTTTNTNGEDIIPNIDDSFITKNLEDIKLAAEGDIDAITRLRVEAAKTIDMDVNINDDQLYSEWNAIASAISALDGTQFEIGGYMDDSEIISALNNILATGKYTVEEFQAMVSQISGGTLSAEVSYETKEITLPTPQFNSTKAYQTIASDGKITSANSWKVLDTKTTVSLPKMQYKYNGGTGAGAKYSGGGGSGSGGSGGGGDSSGSDNTKTEDSEETFDWIETHLTRLDEQMDRLDEKVQDVYTSWADRNKNVRKEMKLLEDQIDANTSAAQSYLNYANSIKVNNGETKVNDDDYGDNDSEQKTYDQSQLTAAINEWKSGKYQELIKQGKLGDDAIEKIKNQYLVDTINEYKTWYEKSIAASDTANSLKITLKEKYKDLFDNIVSQYDDLCTTIEKRTSILDERISRMEEHGYFVSKTYYESQKELEQENYKNLKTERDKLIKQLNEAVETGGIKKGSEAWNDMYQQILDVNKEMETSQNNLVRLDNQQRQNDWDRFDWLQERLHRINEEADHFRSMFDIYKKVDDKGNLTNEGWGNIAMDITKLKNDEEAIKRYNKELAETQALLNKKPGDQNLIQRVEDLQSKLWEYAEDIASIKDSIKNDMNEAFETHLSFLSETIDKYKEALSDAKDLYDYQKNIQNQTANIVKLEKQLAAYQNDDSEAARKKRVELQKQLDDAKQGLEETQWDRYISETGEMLDDMYSDYEEFLNDKLDDIDQLVEDVIKGVTESGGSVTDAINAIVKKFGVETFNLDEMLTNSDKTVTDKINDVITAVQKVAGDVVDELKILQRASQSDAKSSDIKVNDDGTVGTQTTREQQEATKAGVASKSVSDQVQKEEEAKKAKNKTWEKGKFLVWNSETNQLDTKYTGGTWHTTNDGKRYYTYKKNGKTVRLGEGVKGGVTHIIDGVKVHFNSKGYVEWEAFEQELKEPKLSTVSKEELEKKIKLTSLSTGSKNITKKGMYETNEATTGSELVYKTSYGGILTPLDAGDMVFTHEMSQRLWDIAANKIPVDGDIQMVNLPSNINTGTYNINADISITLPNVTNYDEFKKGLQNDDKFEKFIKEITIGQLNRNNTMNKRKY